jgi:RHS repeat-associated protein
MAMKTRYTVVDGEVIAEKRSGVRREYVPDPLGSTVALLDNTQTQTDTFSYWPYGEENTRTGTTATPFQFVGTVGYYSDGTTSTLRIYVRARYLHTQKCRWITQDPIGFDGGDPNFYAYVSNRPITLIDPIGLDGTLPCPVECPPPLNCPPPPACPPSSPLKVIVQGSCRILMRCAMVVGLLCESETPAGGPSDSPPFWHQCQTDWEACTAWCDTNRPYPDVEGRWNQCCHNWCADTRWRCQKGEPPNDFDCNSGTKHKKYPPHAPNRPQPKPKPKKRKYL